MRVFRSPTQEPIDIAWDLGSEAAMVPARIENSAIEVPITGTKTCTSLAFIKGSITFTGSSTLDVTGMEDMATTTIPIRIVSLDRRSRPK